MPRAEREDPERDDARLGRLQHLATSTPREMLTLIGHQYDLACHSLRDFLARNHVPFRFQGFPHEPKGERPSATPQPDDAFPLARVS